AAMKRPARWRREEEIATRFDVRPESLDGLIANGDLFAITFPDGTRRIDFDSVRRLEAAIRRGYVPETLEQLPRADTFIGEWSFPSTRKVKVYLGQPTQGTRRIVAFYDSAAPLSGEDRADLDTRILPAAAAAIVKVTGKRGVGVLALPMPGQ